MTATLGRRLGLSGSVAVGVSAMIGAGLFVVLAPAVEAAGDGVLIALAAAALVAGCNAHSSARLARLHPVAGGTYVFARETIGPFWGHLAGWAFVVGKLASCAAMALAVGAYAWPEQQRLVALAVVVVVTGVNLSGVEKSAVAGITIVTVVLVVVVGVAVALIAAPAAPATPTGPPGRGVIEAAGLLFFAFAGYARLATLGEEVRDPERTIPRAIAIAVVLVVTIYLLCALALLHALGPARLAASPRPFVAGLEVAGLDGWVPLVVGTAALAAAGALLSLMLGVSRTVLAMARDGYLPHGLAHIARRRRVPVTAEIVVAAVVVAVVLLGDLTSSIAFSSFCVLTYYAITNASAIALGGAAWRRVPAWFGLAGCLVLAAFLPPASIVGGAIVLALGTIAYRLGSP